MNLKLDMGGILVLGVILFISALLVGAYEYPMEELTEDPVIIQPSNLGGHCGFGGTKDSPTGTLILAGLTDEDCCDLLRQEFLASYTIEAVSIETLLGENRSAPLPYDRYSIGGDLPQGAYTLYWHSSLMCE